MIYLFKYRIFFIYILFDKFIRNKFLILRLNIFH